MNNKIIRILIISWIIGLCIGCTSSFLDRPPLGELDKDQFIKTEDAGFKLLVNCYNPMAYAWTDQARFDIGDALTDDCAKGGSDAGDRMEITQVSRGNPLPSNVLLTNYWQHRYKHAISACNTLLASVTPEAQLIEVGGALVPQEKKERWIAEGHFLRAMYYFDITMLFGNIPIVDKPLEAVDKGKVVKVSHEEVLGFILADLTAAIESSKLPKASKLPKDEFGRVTHEAALAYRGKVYMWMHEFDKARKDFEAVINSGAYELVDNYELLFSDVELGHKSREAVFISIRDYIPGFNLERTIPPVMDTSRDPTVGGWGGACPTFNLKNEFEDKDPRLVHSIIQHMDRFPKLDGSEETHNNSGYDNFTKMHYRKHYAVLSMRKNGNDLQRTSWSFFHMRYADVLLMYAEALLETGGDKQVIVEILNKIRYRAFVTSSPKDSYAVKRAFDIPESERVTEEVFNSKYKIKITDDLQAAIRHERRVEFAGEGLRLFDLLRWGTFVQTMQSFSKTDEAKYSGAGQNVTTSTWPYPIPQSEIDDIGGSLVQNENYQ